MSPVKAWSDPICRSGLSPISLNRETLLAQLLFKASRHAGPEPEHPDANSMAGTSRALSLLCAVIIDRYRDFALIRSTATFFFFSMPPS